MNTTTKNRHGRSGSGTTRHTGSSNSFSGSRYKPQNENFRGSHTAQKRHGNRSRPHSGKYGRGTRKTPSFNPSRFINTNPVEATSEIYTPKHTFESFGITPQLVRTISSLGMSSPTPIQDQIIPEVLEGHDVIGLAETGTGKTAAFLIPLIEQTLKDESRRTLILAPTRELALQIDEELRRLTRAFRLFSVICVGGINIQPQIKALHRTNHFVIGTPGRILDLINRKHFLPRNITTVVLDEADRMLDMGFIHDMKKILSATPQKRETLFFSATMSSDTKQMVNDFLRDPVVVSVKKSDITSSIEQNIVPFSHNTKFETLTSLLENQEFKRVIIFGSMKHSVEKLARRLSDNRVEAESIHGNKSHGARQQALKKFKTGAARVLVATDVAARGIHIDDVTHVINYDLPNTFEDYVHRIGRTGRCAKKGKALTFVPVER